MNPPALNPTDGPTNSPTHKPTENPTNNPTSSPTKERNSEQKTKVQIINYIVQMRRETSEEILLKTPSKYTYPTDSPSKLRDMPIDVRIPNLTNAITYGKDAHS